MKFFELPQVAQSAACEVLKSNIGSFVTNSADNEPALHLARKINAIFTEMYFPSGKDGGKSPDEAYKELKDASGKLAMQVTDITEFSHLSSDPKLREHYQVILNRASESAARVRDMVRRYSDVS
ncbi:hypothetical protein [Symbiopectobacterium sp.]|uniref:hypothetical protein n=1 Tax=Symbiopectobacterium sp. TaxID=2952789 RepID=UPI003F339DFA